MTHVELFQIVSGAIFLVGTAVSAYVILTLRASVAELRTDLATMENRIVDKINGKYVSKELCKERHKVVEAQLLAEHQVGQLTFAEAEGEGDS